VNFLTTETVLAVFAIFCRVGGCLLIAPGFSSAQIPARIRLFVALAVSLALTPYLIDTIRPLIGNGNPGAVLAIIFSELAVGLMIGFIARLFFLALETITVAMTQAIGLGAIPGTLNENDEHVSSITALFTLTATVIMFISGLHVQLVRGLIDSYATIPPALGFGARFALVNITDQISAAFLVALRIGSPFIVYSIVVNFAVGITNKLTPQIPVFFIAVPFVLSGGLLLMVLTVREFVEYFEGAFGGWLAHG
jgi:flagellar biosynthesis protein FliR